MRLLLISLMLLGTSLFACPGSCGQGAKLQNGCTPKMTNPRSTLGTVNYALHIMQLQDNADITMVIAAYRQALHGMKRGMNTEAFKDGKFDKVLYAQKSRKQQKLQAEIDLFEGIYRVLNDEQKRQSHRLMAAHQHYMGMENTGYGMGPCGCSPCACQNGDGMASPACNAPMRPKGCR